VADSLARYASARDDVAALLEELSATLEPAAHWHGAGDDLRELRRYAERLRTGRFVLAVVGEFSSGKSFLLNALLGKIALEERSGSTRITGLLATDINPSTATITELSYAEEESATAYYPSGRTERIPMAGLARFVAVGGEGKLHDATGDESDAPSLVRIGVASPFLANGFVVADTPGLASINPAHRRATLSYLPGADAVLYLIDTQQPFTDGDASFLGIIRRYIESMFIVQTKIDLWRMTDAASGREGWQAAAARIVAQAAVHAPDTPVFPLSAREYAEGLLTGNEALMSQSRFAEFFAALDASLVATTGRSRLRRAAAEARRIATRAADALALDVAALETDAATLTSDRAAIEPLLAAVDAAAESGRAALVATGSALQTEIVARGSAMRDALHRTLSRAFDTADIARLRDRAKLHILVDETLATAMGRFAGDVADLTAKRLRADAKDAVTPIVSGAAGALRLAPILAAVAAERLPITEDAARAFDADPSSGAWSVDLETGLRGTIVLSALGGPSVSLVSAIAARFASRQSGGYMKRELIADLNADLYTAFDEEVADFVADIGARVERVAGGLAERVATIAGRVRIEAIGAIDRALEIQRSGNDPAAAAQAYAGCAQAVANLATRIETQSERFARESRVDRREHADTGVPLDADAGRERVDPGSVHFDPHTYEHGLRPERWRVAVIGAFKRGKSSLINGIAGSRVLPDEGSDVELRFPVHIRYGPVPKTYALSDDAAWDEIPAAEMVEAALRTPLLVETPWDLPRELVLVHAPPFDSGFSLAEEIVIAAAGSASEILCLFSRQLSDRELDLYRRLAPLGKPMTFVHTIADNETPADRRNVVNLADRYLRERGIVPQRIFTVSTREQGAWNELGALRATLVAHAEEHMERLRRADRERAEHERLASAAVSAGGEQRRRSLFDRLLGRS
jgi:tRNA U34 5-carboxymethylaminomethyl modifying GTPase MnmE/TrmE